MLPVQRMLVGGGGCSRVCTISVSGGGGGVAEFVQRGVSGGGV